LKSRKEIVGKYRFQISLCVILFLSVIFALIYGLCANFRDNINNTFKNEALRNIIVAIAAIATAVFTWWKNSINEKNNETLIKNSRLQAENIELQTKNIELQTKTIGLQENNRLDTLFAQAVGFLKEDNDLITRKAGVHVLKDLAMTSPDHLQKCLDMLCSLNETWMPQMLDTNIDFFSLNRDLPNIKNLREIKTKVKTKEAYEYFNPDEDKKLSDSISLSQLVLLSVAEIIRFVSLNENYIGEYDLSYKYLCTIDLSQVNFSKFRNMKGINLQVAELREAILENTLISEANLSYARLEKANLINANLDMTQLVNSNLNESKLHYAILNQADLSKSHLISTLLVKAKLVNANLEDAILSSVNLAESNFSQAIFTNSKISRIFAPDTLFVEAVFDDVGIEGLDFSESNIERADFRKAKNVDKAIFGENKKDAIFTDEDYKRFYPDSNS